MGYIDRDIYEILRQKEIELVRVRQEVDALKIVIPLVEKDESWHAEDLEEADLSARGRTVASAVQ